MRVVLSTVYAWPEVRRGAERYVHELAAGLARAGHRAHVLSTGRPARDVQLAVPVRRLRRRRWRADRHGELADAVAFGFQCAPRVAATRADVWHANSTGDGAAAALVARGRPGVTTVFTDHGFPAAASRRGRSDRHHHQRIVDHVDGYVCVSAAAGRHLERDYGRVPEVVSPGVHLDAHAPGRREARPTLLYAGAMDEPRKHVRELLAAAVHLQARHPGLQVWLHGGGDVGAVLADVPGAADVVTATGALPPAELAGRYARAWATVLVSDAEAFGMTVVESWASGTPAVVLRGSGGPEELALGGPAVVADGLVPATLASGLEEACDLAADPTTVDRCRDAARPYDWDRAIVPAMLEVYRRAGGRG